MKDAKPGILRRLETRWSGLDRSDRRSVLFLLALPLVVFVVPALAGHPIVAGDNQIQNYPLRVLSGQMIRGGHLPLWNPWIWSGSPLLGGLNAGALYPGTWIYAILPGLMAWTANLVFLYWVCVTGVYVLGRAYGLCSLASLIAAASFGFAGSMTAQMVHLGVVQGAAWIPWMVFGELRLAQIFLPGSATRADARDDAATPTAEWRAAIGWVVLIGVTGGLVFLVGEPRAMTDAAWICAVCPLWWLIRRSRTTPHLLHRLGFVVSIASGAVLAVAIGGVQLLPGVRFLSTTQRSQANLSFFSAGSMHPQWSVLLLVPDVFGGDGVLHQPQYFASENLPEMTGYIGLLACVAAVTLLAYSIGRTRSSKSRTWSVWLVVLVVGLILTFGTFTPLGAPLSHIPFYGGQRIQSRNLTIVDFALAMLLAFWVDMRLSQRRSKAPSQEENSEQTTYNYWQDVVGLIPAFAALLLCVALVAVPQRVESAFGLPNGARVARGLTPWIVAQMVIVLAVIFLVLHWPKLKARSVGKCLGTVVVADLVLFSVACSTGFVAGKGVPLLPDAKTASSLDTGGGRFAIYDPPVTNLPGLIKVGETDLNALTGQPSVQGYGSVVGKTYDLATGTHLDGTLSPCALEGGVFDAFGMKTLLALPGSVAPEASSSASETGSSACGIRWPDENATKRYWVLESDSPVDRIDLAVPNAQAALQMAGSVATGTLKIGVLDASGSVLFPSLASASVSSGPTQAPATSLTSSTNWNSNSESVTDRVGATGSTVDLVVRFERPVRATGIEVEGLGSGEIEDTTRVSGPGFAVVLDGALQDALDRQGWRYTGMLAGFARYQLDTAPRTVWIDGGPATARAQRLSTTIEAGETDEVSSPAPVVVARSEAYASGWKVVATNRKTGTTTTLRVFEEGLFQAVRLPAGDFEIKWSYWAPGLTLGLVASVAGVLIAVGGLMSMWVYRRRAADGPSGT